MPAIDLSVLCIPAECDNIKLPIECEIASRWDAISYSMGNLMLSHSAGMHHTDNSIAGISKRFHSASLHYIFSAYLPTHIKFLTEFNRIFFGTTCISIPFVYVSTPVIFY